MEQPTGEAAVKSEVPINNDQNPKPSVDPKPVDQGPKGSEDAISVVVLSEKPSLQDVIDTTADQTPTRSSSGSRKSVHWNPELVSESPAPDHKAPSSAAVSNPYPYVAPAPAESSDASLKGKCRLSLYMQCFVSVSLSNDTL